MRRGTVLRLIEFECGAIIMPQLVNGATARDSRLLAPEKTDSAERVSAL